MHWNLVIIQSHRQLDVNFQLDESFVEIIKKLNRIRPMPICLLVEICENYTIATIDKGITIPEHPLRSEHQVV